MSRSLKEVFDTEKPIIAVLHLTGCDPEKRLERALGEIEILKKAGIRNVLVENFYGSKSDVENVLKRLAEDYTDMIYGVNVLESFEESFRLAVEYNAAFIQVDTVSGDLLPKEDKKRYGEDLQTLRKNYPEIFVLGGVRAKGFPVSSGRSLEEDVLIGKSRCDAVVVTGYDTGIETELIKIQEFREILGDDFPLIIGSGITAKNVKEQLYVADGAIVGSFLKEQGKTGNLISEDRVVKLMNQIKEADDKYNLKRFLEVQKSNYCGYHYVLKRLRCGQRNEKRKERLTELIAKGNRDDNNIGILWLVFPRVEFDDDLFSNEYAIKSRGEAIAYLAHVTLRKQIYTLCHALLAHDLNDILKNYCDVERVKSTMTLFSEVSDERIFHDVLELYFNGEKCEVTLAKLNEWNKCMQKE